LPLPLATVMRMPNNYSPAAFDNVLTVSALADFDGLPGGEGSPTCRTDQDDTLADFSNWGAAVDIAAPGVCIRSTYPLEKGEYGTISGTSMASPHAAGALALLASRKRRFIRTRS
jgi:subtilisin